eukprot:1140879-Pelagomonas_calceolata.AAC.3
MQSVASRGALVSSISVLHTLQHGTHIHALSTKNTAIKDLKVNRQMQQGKGADALACTEAGSSPATGDTHTDKTRWPHPCKTSLKR